ncbi:MAG: hypothetical protein O2797_02550 [Bacteroidetes bacterium]|nr:hypothetical protein [Bacteroidota bacterium]
MIEREETIGYERDIFHEKLKEIYPYVEDYFNTEVMDDHDYSSPIEKWLEEVKPMIGIE